MSKSMETQAPETKLEIVSLPVNLIDESPFNPRHTFDEAALRELAADVAQRGILQPVLVREKPSKARRRFELVVGARRLRAAKLAKLETIPAVLRAMSDQEVLETQIAENAQRQDVHPLEEGDGYRRLHEQFSVSIDEIAARVSKSRRAIYARIQLSKLREPGRQALLEGKLTASTALLAATLHDPTAQEEFVERLVDWATHDGEPVSYQIALQELRHGYQLRLDEAPWDRADAALVPEAGSCTSCPKRSSAQAELFDEADRERADVCKDRGCWGRKRVALAARRLEAARAEGRPVLEGKAAKAALGERGTHVDVTEQAHRHGVDGRKGAQPLRKLLGKKLPPTAVVVDAKCEVHEVVERGELKKALREGGFKAERGTRSAGKPSSAELRSAKIARFRTLVAAQARARIVARANEIGSDATPKLAGLWALVARALVDECWHESLKGVVARRGWSEKPGRRASGGGLHELVRAKARELQGSAAVALAVELAIARPIESRWRADREHPYGERLEDACAVVGLDLRELEAELAGYLVAVAGPKETPRAKRKGKAAKAARAKGNGKTRSAPAKTRRATRVDPTIDDDGELEEAAP
jgi:ParB/RepB/Spo0J family partition protein